MANKPSIPKGTRDFSPDEMIRRNFIFDTIRSVFKKYGYQNIETPAMENTETLMGKYGEEGDKLIFKILNSGSFLNNYPVDVNELKEELKLPKYVHSPKVDLAVLFDSGKVGHAISEKALRYDLTVPFARYVVQHQNEITFPFKRYQIQPVWRADRPQKGRYREFYQCDADVIGSNSLVNEVELCQMIDEAFTSFNVPVTIKINNRKILAGIAELMNATGKMVDIAIAIDKAEKIGWEGVEKELVEEKGFTKSQFYQFQKLIEGMSAYDTVHRANVGRSQARLNYLKEEFSSIDSMMKGVEEMQYVFDSVKRLGLKTAEVEFFVTLARGLNYYTGAIFEVEVNREKSKSTFTSSICGGGRYDDLTGIFGLPNMSGVGISFGIDRIFDVLNEVGYPTDIDSKEGTRLMFFNNGGKKEELSLQMLREVRAKGIASEIYPDNVKWEKQAKYVDAKKIPFTATVEEDGKIALKYKVDGKWKQEVLNNVSELITKIN